MPQKDDGGSQVNHCEEIVWVAFPADHDPAIVMQPREQAFDFPPTAVAPQRAAILGQSSGAPGTVWCNHLDAVMVHQPFIEVVTIVGAITNQPLREVGEESLFQRGFNEFGFMRRSAGHVHGERKTMPSLIAMILLPLPRRVGPMAEPLFSPS